MMMALSGVSEDRTVFSTKQQSISPEILILTLNYLGEEEFLNCKLVCQEWEHWIALAERTSSAETVFRIPHVVEKMFKHLTKKERLESRLISEAFNLVSSKYLHLKPILTDVTFKSILNIPSDLQVEEIKVSNLRKNLPKAHDGMLKCTLDKDKVKSLIFYEGVTRSNKQILLQSFPNIEELKYISTTNFFFSHSHKYSCIRKLEINSAVYDENGSLRSFFSLARYPALETVELSVQTRLDFLLYLEVHHFIAIHLEKLKKLRIIFGSDFMYMGTDVAKIFRNIPTRINERWLQVTSIFENNKNSLDCRLKFLRCEGISKFQLSRTLHDNLKYLDPGADILFHNPEEDNILEDEDDADEDDDDLEAEAEEEVEEDQIHQEQDDNLLVERNDETESENEEEEDNDNDGMDNGNNDIDWEHEPDSQDDDGDENGDHEEMEGEELNNEHGEVIEFCELIMGGGIVNNRELMDFEYNQNQDPEYHDHELELEASSADDDRGV